LSFEICFIALISIIRCLEEQHSELKKVMIELKAKTISYIQEANKVSVYADIWSKKRLNIILSRCHMPLFFPEDITEGIV